jgi:hypothetical protein
MDYCKKCNSPRANAPPLCCSFGLTSSSAANHEWIPEASQDQTARINELEAHNSFLQNKIDTNYMEHIEAQLAKAEDLLLHLQNVLDMYGTEQDAVDTVEQYFKDKLV